MKNLIVIFILVFLFAECNKEKSFPVLCFNFHSKSIDEIGVFIVGDSIEFENCSENTDFFWWSFGDGTISRETNPKHTYNKSGIYQVVLKAINENGIQEISQEIEVYGLLTGDWSGRLSLSGKWYGFVFHLKQIEEIIIEGDILFSNGNGPYTLSSTSIRIDQKVMLGFSISDLIFTFSGTLNSSFDKVEEYTPESLLLQELLLEELGKLQNPRLEVLKQIRGKDLFIVFKFIFSINPLNF